MVIHEEGLTFDDVLMRPKRGVLSSRSDANITGRLTRRVFLSVPIVSSPMTSVTEDAMANAMYKLGGLGVLHRFNTPVEQLTLIQRMHPTPAACAIGLEDGFERTEKLLPHSKVFVLDVAHAHTDRVIEFVYHWTANFGYEADLIVGSIATGAAAIELENAGAAGFRVGIGPGAACSTRTVTGFGVPQLTAIMEVREATDLPIIADGGIRNSGDIVKALAAGADTVMLGSLLAGADEAPFPGEYFGMASRRVNGHNAPEGVEGHVERTGPVSDTIKALAWGIRSGVSYAGATDLAGLRENAEFIRVSPLSQAETGVRI